ncbi:unnamed protein product [Prorocentrum cordatum]|uniref:Uncharacterized protein n=1 Tax=Prorocentrum cordatum TaxID=2364126 RepID=A0ABN9UIA2_9DINO|nr:unnamed protein product [Polarella glacialis]
MIDFSIVHVGPLMVFSGHLQYLLPHYYLLNALILATRAESEWILRNAVLQSQIITGGFEIVVAAAGSLGFVVTELFGRLLYRKCVATAPGTATSRSRTSANHNIGFFVATLALSSAAQLIQALFAFGMLPQEFDVPRLASLLPLEMVRLVQEQKYDSGPHADPDPTRVATLKYRDVALPLQLAVVALQVPAQQHLGTAWTLRNGVSPARYKIAAWLVSTAVAILLLSSNARVVNHLSRQRCPLEPSRLMVQV